jgi:hypothetical protein
MNYVQRKMIAFMASIAFALVYLPLRYQPYGLDLAICAGFTVTMFLNAKRKRGKAGLLFGKDAIPFLQLLPGHALALAALVGIVRLGIYAAPVLPGWLTNPLGNAPGGHPLPSLFRYTQTFMVFILGFVESWWLTQVKTKEEKEAQSRVAWTKSAFDQRMGERLRLH